MISDEKIKSMVLASKGASRESLVRFALKKQSEAIADRLKKDIETIANRETIFPETKDIIVMTLKGVEQQLRSQQ